MGRTVAYAQDGNPEWLRTGRQWLHLTAEMPASAAARAMELASAEVRSVQRWARAAQFLDSEYPAYAASVRVGSVAVLSLAKLHRLDAGAANTLAERVFSGRLTSAQINREVTAWIERSERAKMLRHRSGSAWRASFREAALRRLEREPQALGRPGRLVGFEENQRSALKADLLVFFEEPNAEVAIVVRAPRDTAAKSATTVASQLMSEIGLMLLHYQDVLVLLPASAAPICEAVSQLWKNWVRSDVRQSRRLSFGLLDGENGPVNLVQLSDG